MVRGSPLASPLRKVWVNDLRVSPGNHVFPNSSNVDIGPRSILDLCLQTYFGLPFLPGKVASG